MMDDIEKMYYQVRVPEEDTDLLRFLWWPNGDFTQDVAEYKMVVHLFGATSSPSCATFALQRTAQENGSKSSDEAVDTVLKNFYVDDCLKSVSTETQAITLREDLTALCAEGVECGALSPTHLNSGSILKTDLLKTDLSPDEESSQ